MRKYISNIVIGNKAKKAEFKEGYNASVPIAFTAETATYTRENMRVEHSGSAFRRSGNHC